jgi:hypothetical protein
MEKLLEDEAQLFFNRFCFGKEFYNTMLTNTCKIKIGINYVILTFDPNYIFELNSFSNGAHHWICNKYFSELKDICSEIQITKYKNDIRYEYRYKYNKNFNQLNSCKKSSEKELIEQTNRLDELHNRIKTLEDENNKLKNNFVELQESFYLLKKEIREFDGRSYIRE